MGISVSNIMATSAQIRWTVPFITSTPESYYVIYGFDPSALLMQSPSQTSGANISTVYLQLLTGLDPVEIYYYRVIASNAAGESGSDIYSFMTPDGRKYSFNYTGIHLHILFSQLQLDLH